MHDWRPFVRRRLESLQPPEATRHGLVQEIAGDLEDRFAACLAAGETPADAKRTLLAELDELRRRP